MSRDARDGVEILDEEDHDVHTLRGREMNHVKAKILNLDISALVLTMSPLTSVSHIAASRANDS